MSKEKSTLMTPDPYHIPGYCGYCPQFKYQIGETFGRTTSCLLTDNSVAYSGKPVLSDIEPQVPPKADTRRDTIKNRAISLGDQKLTDQMVPGYTGYIPKAEHYYGNSYAETSRSAIADFHQNQLKHRQKAINLRTITEIQRGKQVLPELITSDTRTLSKFQVPLKAIADKPKMYYSKKAPQHSLSPLALSNDNPKKHHKSGYSGFVPRYRGLMGEGYPVLTNKALIAFSSNMENMKKIKDLPVTIERPEVRLVDTRPIYPKNNTGLVPHFTGHVPGEKFRYGMTFGYSTRYAQQALTA
ncbi:predicted protein [Nematostella vectensis]|uniref:Ciliary microtubule inner protein 2A-C-like domain-containing protein n=1 Tax=Nematostella vectensis TaxID=45351 RepID=A7SZG1_NEMVE|nr:predicted protein [Nematostella vectensis]|eukprot:XP_001623010.1 hypothetical protein NEMVEDRAFT_v1g219959 [Nematostella vectensis]